MNFLQLNDYKTENLLVFETSDLLFSDSSVGKTQWNQSVKVSKTKVQSVRWFVISLKQLFIKLETHLTHNSYHSLILKSWFMLLFQVDYYCNILVSKAQKY